MFDPFLRAVAQALAALYELPVVGGSYGEAIILLTLLIRVLTWPINQKVYTNSEKMKEVQPKLTAIKEKYKDDQQRQAEETMKVWKEEGVSPLGCLPMLLQFPILLALYYMILNSTTQISRSGTPTSPRRIRTSCCRC